MTCFTEVIGHRNPKALFGALEKADFIDISTRRKLADNCAKYLAKGGQAAVIGRIKTRSYEDNQGVKRKAWEVEADDVRFLQRAPAGSNLTDDAAPEIDTGQDFPL